jgi:hypothetical protein
MLLVFPLRKKMAIPSNGEDILKVLSRQQFL